MTTGQQLGRYQIIREIARSNDIVYEAIDPGIGRRVALKELQLPPNLVGSAKVERIQRFKREAQAAGALTHPNIVTIFEVGQQGDRHYIAMEFLEGQTLQDAIDQRGGLPAEEAIDIICQVLDALQFAHEHGVVHRDIKPANIQILPGRLVKLTDFGIARIMHEPSITQSGQIFGTPSYMSPEQIAGRDLDGRSDLFSVAVVLYEALTGAKPFGGDSVVSITYSIMNQLPASPAGVPQGLAEIVLKGLSKNASDRFSSASEFRAALRSNWQTAAPSPFGVSSNAPPPIFFPPGTQFPTTAQPPASHLPPPTARPRPQAPPEPLLTPGEKSCVNTIVISLLLAGLVIWGISGLSRFWDSYQQSVRDAQVMEQVNKAVSAVKVGQYEQAISGFEDVLRKRISPELQDQVRGYAANAWVQIADRHLTQGDWAGAKEAVDKALSVDPTSGDAYYYNGVLFARQGQWDSAASQWERALEDPASSGGRHAREQLATYYFRLAENAEMRGSNREAFAYYQRVVQVAAGTDLGQRAQAKIEQMQMGGGPQ